METRVKIPDNFFDAFEGDYEAVLFCAKQGTPHTVTRSNPIKNARGKTHFIEHTITCDGKKRGKTVEICITLKRTPKQFRASDIRLLDFFNYIRDTHMPKSNKWCPNLQDQVGPMKFSYSVNI